VPYLKNKNSTTPIGRKAANWYGGCLDGHTSGNEIYF